MNHSERTRLARDLQRILLEEPKQDKYQLLYELEAEGWSDITKSDINSVLYSNPQLFERSDDSLPRWSATGRETAIPIRPRRRSFLNYAGPPPRDWQLEAFDAWQKAGRRGVVEAVTGTGKTTVGILAIAEAATRGLDAFVLVPSLDLLDQWYAKLTKELPRLSVGRLGDGRHDSLHDHNVIVGTVQSACKYVMLPEGLRGLLIADEVHRYGAQMFSRALEPEFEERLGLTATYEREDNGLEQYLTPYFSPVSRRLSRNGEVVANCSYARGLNDGILARFRVGLIGVEFTPGEQEEYDELDATARQARNSLIQEHGCPDEPFGEFMKAASVLSEGNAGYSRGTMTARRYLNAFTKRRALLADCTHKLAALKSLSRVLSSAKRAIVFTETVSSADAAANALRRLDIPAEAYTSELKRAERKELLTNFRAGELTVLAAPRVLDEGIDVPEADVGVIVAASRSRRQMVQRMGRIIRPKKDNRRATFLILYVRNTSEDPELGAHDAFLSEMVDNADEIEYFSPDARTLFDWYRNP